MLEATDLVGLVGLCRGVNSMFTRLGNYCLNDYIDDLEILLFTFKPKGLPRMIPDRPYDILTDLTEFIVWGLET